MIHRTLQVYDNQDKSLDRFTVIIDGAVYGMSEDQSPQGFNQYCCEIHELGVAENLGKRVELNDLPKSVLVAIVERMTT